jgi:hypothetical protein
MACHGADPPLQPQLMLKTLKDKQDTCHLQELMHNVTTSQARTPCVCFMNLTIHTSWRSIIEIILIEIIKARFW